MSAVAVQALPEFHIPHTAAEGLESVEAEHHHLHLLLEDLVATVHARRGPLRVAELFEALVLQTAKHFHHEEMVMHRYDYEGSGRHKHEHRAIIKRLRVDRNQYATGVEILTIPAVERIKKMLDAHVANEDQVFLDFLATVLD